MPLKGQSLQSAFFDNVRENQVPVSVFLLNGVRLQGVVIGHDSFTVQLLQRGALQTIYKRAVATVSPERPIQLWSDDKAP